jgi:predicted P-loop ATPase
LHLPNPYNIKGYDVTDYFQSHSTQDFQNIIDFAVKNKSEKSIITDTVNTDPTIFHQAESYLSKKYDLRLDVIANEIEVSVKGENNWYELNDDQLYVEMQKKHIKISIGNLRSILLSDFIPKFNPFQDYFEKLSLWNGKTDYIKQFCDYVELEVGEDKQQFVYHFKKWFVRSVKCSTIDGYYNKQAFVLSDDAKGQNIGKTTFIRFIIPKILKKYYCENLPEDKDALKRLGQNMIINLDELATLSKTDINKLKAMFSYDNVKTRLPYGKKDIIIPRVANFIGSTNMSTFLVDESGSVRWLCFVVKKINFAYSKEFNIDNLWSQALTLSKDENFKEELTPEDIKINEKRNDKFQTLGPERELIPKYFEIPTSSDVSEFMNATEIMGYIQSWAIGLIKLNREAVGRSLPKCGFIRVKHKGYFGYWVIKKLVTQN